MDPMDCYSAIGTVTARTKNYEVVTSYLDGLAERLGVTYSLGSERIVGSRGFFRRETVSSSSLSLTGPKYLLEGLTEALQAFIADIESPRLSH